MGSEGTPSKQSLTTRAIVVVCFAAIAGAGYCGVLLVVAYQVLGDVGADGLSVAGSLTPLLATLFKPFTNGVLSTRLYGITQYEKALSKADTAAKVRKRHTSWVAWAFAVPGVVVAIAVVLVNASET